MSEPRVNLVPARVEPRYTVLYDEPMGRWVVYDRLGFRAMLESASHDFADRVAEDLNADLEAAVRVEYGGDRTPQMPQ